jgi:hypothetical protein
MARIADWQAFPATNLRRLSWSLDPPVLRTHRAPRAAKCFDLRTSSDGNGRTLGIRRKIGRVERSLAVKPLMDDQGSFPWGRFMRTPGRRQPRFELRIRRDQH